MSIFREGFTMYFNRDEFMLLSRGGRVPPAVRAGPPRRDHEVYDLDLPARQPWLVELAAAAVHGMVRHRRSAAGAGRAPVGSDGVADRDGYLELEFAVGFVSDDEPSR